MTRACATTYILPENTCVSDGRMHALKYPISSWICLNHQKASSNVARANLVWRQ